MFAYGYKENELSPTASLCAEFKWIHDFLLEKELIFYFFHVIFLRITFLKEQK